MKFFTNSNDVDTSLGIAERTAYGFGNFANAFMFIAIAVYLTYYYTNVIGLNAAIIGTIMLVSRCFDGITDLGMGYILDHSKEGTFGKSRKWLLRSCIPFAITGIFVFMVPQNASDVLKYVFVFLSYNICNSFCYTAVSVSYNSLMVKITRNPMERGLLGIFLMVFSTLSGLIVTSTCLKLVDFFGGDASAWTKTIIVYSVLGLAAHMICIFGTKERIKEEMTDPDVVKAETPGFKESFSLLLKNKYWLTTTLAYMIYWMGYTLMNSGHMYYAQYIMGDANYQPAMANVIQVVTLAAMLLAYLPMKLWGKGTSVRIGAVIAVLSFALQLIFGANYTGVLICCALHGFGYGLFCAVIGGLTPDNLDYGEWKYGKNVTGMGCAAVSFGQKVGTGLAGGIFGIILGAGGYDGMAATQSSSALMAIRVDYIILPLICAVLSLLLMWKYDLDKKFPEIQAELKARNNNN